MMRFGLALRDQLLSDEEGKRQVSQPIAVHMSQLAPPESKLRPAKSVRSARDTGPRRYFPYDCLQDALGHVCALAQLLVCPH